MDMPVVLKEISNGVAFITLNRETKMNAINKEMALQLHSVLDECRNDKAVRVVLVTGKGKAFCAGQDLIEASAGLELEKILPEQLNPLVKRVVDMPKPVIAAVNGIAAGAGASIALCCDIVVASSSAQFTQAFGRLGLVPDSGATYFLPRMVGWQKAAALMMLGEKITAQEAERMGMIYKWFDEADFENEYKKIAFSLAEMSPEALSLTKMALQRSAGNTLEEQLKLEEQLQASALQGAEFRKRLDAFHAKRIAAK